MKFFEIKDMGIEHYMFFPGATTVDTPWDLVYTGAGDTLREAIADCLEAAGHEQALDGIGQEDLQTEIEGFGDGALDAALEDSHQGEVCHYAAIFVR